jgi:hypothetical protein
MGAAMLLCAACMPTVSAAVHPPRFRDGGRAAAAAPAQAERERAERLAAAKATTARLWRPLEEAGFHDVADRAALVMSCAADPDRPRRELDQALADLHHATATLASLARQYRDADDLTRELTVS